MLYLPELHARINAIAPITGLSVDDSDYVFDIQFVEPPTAEQRAQIDAVLAAWPQEQERLKQIAQLDADFAATIAAGWETPGGWRLGLSAEDASLLLGVFILTSQSVALGVSKPDTPVRIIDTENVAHTLTLPELTSLLLAYGQARAAIADDYAARVAALR